MLVLEVKPNRFDFNQQFWLVIELYRKVTDGPTDRVLSGDLRILIVAEEIRQKVGRNHHGIGFVNVPRFGGSKNRLKTLEAINKAVFDFLWNGRYRSSSLLSPLPYMSVDLLGLIAAAPSLITSLFLRLLAL
jgi:hypothetical protein